MPSSWITPSTGVSWQEWEFITQFCKALKERGASVVLEEELFFGMPIGFDHDEATYIYNAVPEDSDLIGWNIQHGHELYKDAVGREFHYAVYEYYPENTISWRYFQDVSMSFVRQYGTAYSDGWVNPTNPDNAPTMLIMDKAELYLYALGSIGFRKTPVDPNNTDVFSALWGGDYGHGKMHTQNVMPAMIYGFNLDASMLCRIRRSSFLEINNIRKYSIQAPGEQPKDGECCAGVYYEHTEDTIWKGENSLYCGWSDTLSQWMISTAINTITTRHWFKSGSESDGPQGTYTPWPVDEDGDYDAGGSTDTTMNNATVVYFDQPGKVWITAGVTTETTLSGGYHWNPVGDYYMKYEFDSDLEVYLPSEYPVGGLGLPYYVRDLHRDLPEFYLYYHEETESDPISEYRISTNTGGAPWWGCGQSSPYGNTKDEAVVYTPKGGSDLLGNLIAYRADSDWDLWSFCVRIEAETQITPENITGGYPFYGRYGSAPSDWKRNIPYFRRTMPDGETYRVYPKGNDMGNGWEIQKLTSTDPDVWTKYWEKSGTLQGVYESIDDPESPGTPLYDGVLSVFHLPQSDIIGKWIFEDLQDVINKIVWYRKTAQFCNFASDAGSAVASEKAWNEDFGVYSTAQEAWDNASGPTNTYAKSASSTGPQFGIEINEIVPGSWFVYIMHSQKHYMRAALKKLPDIDISDVRCDFWVYTPYYGGGISTSEWSWEDFDINLENPGNDVWNFFQSVNASLTYSDVYVYSTEQVGTFDKAPIGNNPSVNSITNPLALLVYNDSANPAFDYY